MAKTGWKQGLASLLALALCAGCGGQEAPQESGNQDGIMVCASFQTMAEFTQMIAGDKARVEVLAPSGGDPHDWEPSPRDISRLEDADLLVLNGAGFEHWADGILSTLHNEALVVVDTSLSVDVMAGQVHDHKHEHDDDDHNHENPEHEAGEREDHDHVESGHSHEALDPHIWLSPVQAGRQLAAIRDGLIQADPANQAAYEENYAAAAQRMEQLDQLYRDTLDSLPRKEIVVAHAAFGYLCAEYGLTQVAVQGLSPEGEPNPTRMAEIIEYTREHEIRVIFFEEMASPKVAEAIARDAGVETAVLNPLEGFSEEQLAAGEDYFTVMERNLEQLKAALS